MEKFTDKLNIDFGNRAKLLIPGGAHTYSKGDDQFPANAPKIIDRGLGCKLWDVDGNQFTDMAMSLGSVILGHAYEPVLKAVRKEIKRGVNFCRPSVIEGELAEILVDIIPSAEMVKFGKNGSDAVTAAIKLARAYTGRKFIARCSSDPFNAIHDWFIGSTIMNRGVPEEIQHLTIKFNYNDIESCEKLFDLYPDQIACFIFEPVSFEAPKDNFLQKLKALCEKNGTLLIFDEVVSGFRFALGGVQEIVGVIPHLAAFGKAMANGFSVSALVGQREFMRLGGIDHDQERVFLLSTTHGGETHCLAASIACINEIRKHDIIKHFWQTGQALINGVLSAAKEVDAEKYIDAFGYGVKPAFIFKDETGQVSMVARTLFMQETIAQGLLMPYVVPSYAHKKETINFAIECVRNALIIMKKAAEGKGMAAAIEGNIVKPVFRKHN
ncbi:MAG: glutamate-1-semialdehyde 2,1-aminomutase [Bacteroidia bacterium]|nr:glutamate-1-semialdehyde 2,1-aminomutase [Bacteroidia bacterium]